MRYIRNDLIAIKKVLNINEKLKNEGINSARKRYGTVFLKETIRLCVFCKIEYNPKRSEQKCCSRECSLNKLLNDKDSLIENGRKGGNKSLTILNRRSKAEICFADLCIKKYGKENILCNELFFKDKKGNLWDADIIIKSLKIAILYNGIFHYKKVYKNQKLDRMIAKDTLKEKIIIENGYTYYIVKDLGKFNKSFVENQFHLFIHKVNFEKTLNLILSK